MQKKKKKRGIFHLPKIMKWHNRYIVNYGFVDKDLKLAVGWNISLIQLQMRIWMAVRNDRYSNSSIYKWWECELIVMQEAQINTIFHFASQFSLQTHSQQTSACTWCLFLAVLGSWEIHSVPARSAQKWCDEDIILLQ